MEVLDEAGEVDERPPEVELKSTPRSMAISSGDPREMLTDNCSAEILDLLYHRLYPLTLYDRLLGES